jgi:SAM-dependent methyltransferase
VVPDAQTKVRGVAPRPEDVKERIAGGFGRAAPTYDTVIPFFRTFADHLVEVAAPGPGAQVLDVASGRGACLRAAAARIGGGGRVVGVELSPAMVEHALHDLATSPPLEGRIEVGVGDAERLGFPDSTFDVAICGFGVFFFPDPDRALAEIHRVLRPGGRFALSTFVGTGGYPWAHKILRRLRPDAQGSRSPVATAAGLAEHLTAVGFGEPTVTLVEERFILPDADAYMAWSWSTGIRSFLETFSDDELARFREEAVAHLAAHEVNGGYEMVQGAELTVTTKPG